MRVLIVLAVVGHFLRMFSLAFVPPLLYAIVEIRWESALHFGVALVAALAFGTWLARAQSTSQVLFRRAEALAVVSLAWLAISLFGAIPYAFSGLSLVDAFFESMSGFTTTGATVLTDFSRYDDAFFLWRAMTQWFGGLGVIALFVVILPRVGIAGRQLFFAEASGAPGENVSPQVRNAASRLWLLYTGLTVLLIGLLHFQGLPLFDSVCHGLTTLSAGGFSPHAESIAGYENAAVEWTLVVFMLLAGTSFPLLWKTFSRKPLALFRDGEFLLYLGVAVCVALAMSAVLMSEGVPEIEEALRLGFFQSASVISSTGFASTDYNLWGDGARILIIVVMLVGGCAGSAAGGPKAIRHLLVAKHVFNELRRILHPKAMLPVKYKGRIVRDPIMRAVFTLVVLYVGAYFAVGVFMVLMGNDIVTGFSASLAAVGNIGPGFGAAGPMGNFAGFGDAEKIVLTLGMWIGRLEIVTVFALLNMKVLRNLHWRRFKPDDGRRIGGRLGRDPTPP